MKHRKTLLAVLAAALFAAALAWAVFSVPEVPALNDSILRARWVMREIR